MLVRSLWVCDFRCYLQAEVSFAEGLTAVVGANGQGKTSLLEAIGVAAGLGSIRGAAHGALVRDGAEVAQIRCDATGEQGRDVLVQVEIPHGRANRVQLNHQRVSRRRDLLGVLPVTVFSPEDLNLVKGEPAVRRAWLDDALAAVSPASAALRSEVDRVLRQRNALLRQAAGRISRDVAVTLEVWDEKLSASGGELRELRLKMLNSLELLIEHHYRGISLNTAEVSARYVSSWGEETLAAALMAARQDDLRRATTTIGPHRDEIVLGIDGLPTRSHASQGEQRSLALALRLAVDTELRERCNVQPLLLLDDMFSELDALRTGALVATLPAGQRIFTTAAALPPAVSPDRIVRVNGSSVTVEGS